MKTSTLGSMIRWRVRRRFHPLERVGWTTTRTARTNTQTVIGVLLMVAGWSARTSRKRTRLYRATVEPGESLRIRVVQGGRVLDDATIEV